MPNGWMHAVINLIVYGRPYFDLHKKKDKASQTLGWEHRKIGHKWYKVFGEKWTLEEPFPFCLKDQIFKIRNIKSPDKAERLMAYVDHDYIDRIWDNLSHKEKKYWEGFFAWLIFKPKILKEWAGVDVLEGRVQRVINGREVWEDCPQLKSEYRDLCKYVKAVKNNSEILQDMIEQYGKG